jgi:hypothetical protein
VIAFGAFFILQGALFIWSGIIRPDLKMRFRPGLAGWAGALLITYALILYPMLGHSLGHQFPAAPTFGVTPCPTVIFTLGYLLWSEGRLPLYLLVVPSLWALIGFSAAVQLGMFEDLGLLVAAVTAVLLILVRRQPRTNPQLAAR